MLADADDTILTDEEIQKILDSTKFSNLYKVYFDNVTGDILSITNEINSSLSHYIEVPHTDVEDFLSGKINLSLIHI